MLRSRLGGTQALTGGLALIAALALAGCHGGSAATSSTASASASVSASATSAATASASPGFSVPGTHRSTTVYRTSSRLAAMIVTGHVGDVTVTGGAGTATTVTQELAYSRTPPVTSDTIRGRSLTVTYTCPAQLVCGVAYVIRLPRDVAVQAHAGTGAIRLAGLAGTVTAQATVGLIDASGLTGASVSLTTGIGGITVAFAAAPATVQASARVGAITLHVPGQVSYKVSASARVGRATVSVPQSPSSGHAITATTDVGAVTVEPGA